MSAPPHPPKRAARPSTMSKRGAAAASNTAEEEEEEKQPAGERSNKKPSSSSAASPTLMSAPLPSPRTHGAARQTKLFDMEATIGKVEKTLHDPRLLAALERAKPSTTTLDMFRTFEDLLAIHLETIDLTRDEMALEHVFDPWRAAVTARKRARADPLTDAAAMDAAEAAVNEAEATAKEFSAGFRDGNPPPIKLPIDARIAKVKADVAAMLAKIAAVAALPPVEEVAAATKKRHAAGHSDEPESNKKPKHELAAAAAASSSTSAAAASSSVGDSDAPAEGRSKRKYKQAGSQAAAALSIDLIDVDSSRLPLAHKRPRTEEASNSPAAAAASSSSASAAATSSATTSIASPAAIHRVLQAPKRVLRTLDLIDFLTATEGSVVDRVTRVVKLIQEGADTGDEFAMLDMSLNPDEGKDGSLAAWFLFLRFYVKSCGSAPADTPEIQKQKTDAHTRLTTIVEPLVPRLLASFDPTLTDAATGNNALSFLLAVMYPLKSSWIVFLIKEMARRGVSCLHRNLSGRTPMHVVASVLTPPHSSAYFAPLLQSLGGDLNLQDGSGDTVLHILIRGQSLAVLRDLFTHDDAQILEYHTKNKANQTPAELAAHVHVQDHSEDTRKVLRLIVAQTSVYTKQIRPIIVAALMDFNIKDLSMLIVGYLDGSGPPHVLPDAQKKQAVGGASGTQSTAGATAAVAQ